ncbi:MAG: B12-binding domain-containing radical SAM protein [Promethearchaeota archaeon]
MITENVIIKDWRNIDFSLGLIYPSEFKLGMSSYSIRLLYYFINSFKNIACERIFLPDNINIKYPASKDFNPKDILRSLENKILPDEFDILGFSLHFENDFKNIFWILEKAEIPFSYQKRLEIIRSGNVQLPLVIAGGPVITSNPIPFSKFFDLLFIGDSEESLPKFFNLYQRYKEQKINLKEFLDIAKEIEGIFVPAVSNRPRRAILKNIDNSPTPLFQLISKTHKNNSVFEPNFLLEVNRGCPFQCKFCISSFHNSPFRNRSFNSIINAIKESIKISNYETISLIGSCVSAHPKFHQICKYINDIGKRLTVPSIRIDHLTQDLIKIFEKAGIRTITIAPETGSEDLRFALGKKISNEKIITTIKEIRDSLIKNVKFYYLIGLPNETEEDIDDIIELLKSISNLGFPKNSLRVNINPFIPKLNTPYEKEVIFYLTENLSSLLKKYQKLYHELKSLTSIKLKFKNFKNITKNARLQTLISIGDLQVSEILLKTYLNGATFTSLQKAEKELDFSFDNYLLKIRNCYSPWNL